MGWNRANSLTTELPPKPSFMWWYLAGVLTLIIGIVLFMIHASGMMNAISGISIWLVSLAPSGSWLFLLCLRGWLWGKKVDEHNFLKMRLNMPRNCGKPGLNGILRLWATVFFYPTKSLWDAFMANYHSSTVLSEK